MVQIEDETARLDTVCSPLQYHANASVTQVVGTSNFPPSFAAVGYAPCFKGFGPAPGSSSTAPFATDAASSPAFVKRAEVSPSPSGGAFQHVKLFKNVLVAADGGASAKIYVFDVRDWKEKQVIRVGAVPKEHGGVGEGADGDDAALAPAAVTMLAFDGLVIAAGTAEGFVHTWKLMEHEGKRGYARLLNPLKVDSQPITRVHLGTQAELLTAYAASKRTLVCWELSTGKLRGAYNVDGVAKGVPMALTANCESVIACVHAHKTSDGGGKGNKTPPLAALLDVQSGEGGAVKDVSPLLGEGDPACIAFDGELLAVGTTAGAVIAWNVGEGYAAWKGYHGGSVDAICSVPDNHRPRLLSGAADRTLLLWDKTGMVQARLEVGAGVTSLHAPTSRTAVCGTSAGMVELLALCAPDATADEALTVAAKGGRRVGNELVATAWRHYPGDAPDSRRSFEAYTRAVRVDEGDAPLMAAPEETKETKKAEKAKAKAVAKGMMRGLREDVEASESEEAIAARKKKEDEEEAAKHRAMDASGVARNPNVKATADRVRKCANPSCVAREDTIARAGGKMLRCSRCKAVSYCSPHCQRTHWRDGHRGTCVPAAATPTKEVAKEVAKDPEPKPPPATARETEVKETRRALVVEDDSEDDESDAEEEAVEADASAAATAAAATTTRRPLVVEEESDGTEDSDDGPPPLPDVRRDAKLATEVRKKSLVIEEEDDVDSDSDDDDALSYEETPEMRAERLELESLDVDDELIDMELVDMEDLESDEDDENYVPQETMTVKITHTAPPTGEEGKPPALPPWMTAHAPPKKPPEKPPAEKAEAKSIPKPAEVPAAPRPVEAKPTPPPAPAAVDPALEPVNADDLLYDLD